MIKQEKYDSALRALHLLITRIRFLACQENKLKEIATISDYAERLPLLISDKEDKTEEFKKYLVGITQLYPSLSYILRAFDSKET